MTILPIVKEKLEAFKNDPILTCKKEVAQFLDNQTEKSWSLITLVLSFICLSLIFVNNGPAVKRIVSPILAPIQTLYAKGNWDEKDFETFSFAPGSASWKKLSRIDMRKLGTLSYYDLPIDKDGTFVYDSAGYRALSSQDVLDVFERARQNGTRVTLVITQTYNSEIERILDNTTYQQTVIDETVREVQDSGANGVTIDFEYTGDTDPYYRNKFSSFVENFTNQMHDRIPGSHVSVALGTTSSPDSLYDVPRLGEAVDKVFLMAYTMAVPEFDGEKLVSPKNVNSDEYMKNLDKHVGSFAYNIPQEKLVIERAWYGNGDNYPLYMSDTAPKLGSGGGNTMSLPLSDRTINRLVRNISPKARESARKNLPFIAEALQKEGMLNANVLAYALATIEHETADTFEPISEFKGRKSARRLGYEGGTNYFGRGFIQLTHSRNYEKMGKRIGMGDALVKNPELASDPKVAAAILAAFFEDNNVAYWAEQGQFVTARIPINPDSNGWQVASLAWVYLEELG